MELCLPQIDQKKLGFFYFIQDIGTSQDIRTYILKKKLKNVKGIFLRGSLKSISLISGSLDIQNGLLKK